MRTTKICKSCKKELPATLEYFTKYKHCKLGVANYCKECVNRKKREARREKGFTKRELKSRASFTFDENGEPIFRKCSKCHKEKPLDEFYDEKNGYLGKMAKCKDCFKVLMERRKIHNIENRIEPKVKVCNACGQEKSITKFYTDAKAPDGKTVKCIRCIKTYHRRHYIENAETIKAKRREYAATPKGRQTIAEWERRNSWRRPLYREKPTHKEKARQWWANNPDKATEYRKKKLATPKGALDARVGAHMRMGLKKGTCGQRWLSLIPYSLKELYDRLSKTMPDGYTWQDYQNGDLQVDHIIPLAAFPYETPDNINFQKAWALENLQLLPKVENQKKWAKLEKPFQPYLGFSINER